MINEPLLRMRGQTAALERAAAGARQILEAARRSYVRRLERIAWSCPVCNGVGKVWADLKVLHVRNDEVDRAPTLILEVQVECGCCASVRRALAIANKGTTHNPQ